MSYQEPLSQKAVAISISESDDLAVLGLAPEHLRDAMTEIARHLLAMGARLVYGGDLRNGGFTELLFELVARHRRDADIGDPRPAVLSYLPWPVHAVRKVSDLEALKRELAGIGELHCLDQKGLETDLATRPIEPSSEPTDTVWSQSLTAMRAVLTDISNARIVLGGRTTKFKGRMPGIAEETLFALQAGQPLYVLGGFGGCARDIARDIGISELGAETDHWQGREEFKGFGTKSLANGLTDDENFVLARTVHVDQAIALILRGMLRLAVDKV